MSDLPSQGVSAKPSSSTASLISGEPAFPSFREAVKYWLKLGFISFGGPAGQISVMHRELVEKRRWISESHFLHALNFCMLLPGPEAQQLATYLGWRLHGIKGGLAAGLLFILPAAVIMYLLSWLYVTGGDIVWLKGIFYGLQCAVVAVVVSALLRIAKKALKTPVLWLAAVCAFIAIFVFGVSFVWLVLTAGMVGYVGNRWLPKYFPAASLDHKTSQEVQAPAEAGFVRLPTVPGATFSRTGILLSVCGVLWWLPVIVSGLTLGWDSTISKEGVFFSKAAMVTFGGAYAVLPYVAQQAVEQYEWLAHGQMMSGLALAETTPGPLIMVLQFVGFVGGWQNPVGMHPLMAASMGALITTWVTFIPCFLMVFLGAPHVEDLRFRPRLGSALSTITAAVVGVILNLTLWFSWHTLWPEGWHSERFLAGMDVFAIALGIATYIALDYFRLGLVPVIISAAGLGLIWTMAFS